MVFVLRYVFGYVFGYGKNLPRLIGCIGIRKSRQSAVKTGRHAVSARSRCGPCVYPIDSTALRAFNFVIGFA